MGVLLDDRGVLVMFDIGVHVIFYNTFCDEIGVMWVFTDGNGVNEYS